MTKVTLSIMPQSVADIYHISKLASMGDHIRDIVARAASTENTKLTRADVDWIPQMLPHKSVAADISVEIETIAFPDRKAKLGDRATALKLKEEIFAALSNPRLDPEAQLLWIKFWDPAGPHV